MENFAKRGGLDPAPQPVVERGDGGSVHENTSCSRRINVNTSPRPRVPPPASHSPGSPRVAPENDERDKLLRGFVPLRSPQLLKS